MKVKQLIEELKNDTDTVLTSLDEDNLKKLIEYLADRYYNFSEALISDTLFDYVKEFYENTYKDSVKGKVGTAAGTKQEDVVVHSKKVKLPCYMGSLDKIKPSTGAFNKWISKYPGPYVVSYKLDGISALLFKKNNKVHMYTRGNGIEGQDITNCIEHIGINTKNMVEGDCIRGELIMSKENFKKISDKMANARNAVGGIVNTKVPDPNMLKLIHFVAYWTINPEFRMSVQLKYIEKKKFVPSSVDYFLKKQITTDDLSQLLIKGRKEYKYEIDGIVVIDDSVIHSLIPDENPEYGFAFKQVLTDQIAESTVVDVIWEISKDKYIKPKIKINTVELLGSEITYATAFNAKFIVDNCIGPGTVVKIIKSGDIIPYIMEILKPSETGKPKMPSIKYEWNETKVDIIAKELNKESMNKLIVKKLAYFFSKLDIKYMAETTIEKFVENGYDDLWKILTADKTKLYKIEGLGQKSIDKIYTNIENGLTNINLYDLMAASQIFGRGIGSKKFKLITEAYPNIIEIFLTKGKTHTYDIINNISGYDTVTTNKVVDNFSEFITYYNKFIKLKPNLIMKKVDKIKTNKSKVVSKLTEFAGKTIVFTGFRDKDVEVELENIGSKITNAVSKNTDIVIVADVNDESTKIKKAKELNIKIISKNDFYKLVKKE
jgi:NAD-dependent DNA ligase